MMLILDNAEYHKKVFYILTILSMKNHYPMIIRVSPSFRRVPQALARGAALALGPEVFDATADKREANTPRRNAEACGCGSAGGTCPPAVTGPKRKTPDYQGRLP